MFKINLNIEWNKKLIIITAFFGIIYCLISLINHTNFRTYGWDLGIYNQAIYDYAHFRLNHNTVLQPPTNNMLSDHFTLLHFLISPLYWVFKSYTLLVFQIASILFGGVGVYRYIYEKSKNRNLSLLAIIHFFSLWGIYSALGFGYHDNVVGAMFVPWFIYYLTKEKYIKAALCFLILLISKENMIIWAIFLGLGMLIVHYKHKTKRFFLIGITVFAALFFQLVMKIIMPALADEGHQYVHFTYSVIGEDFTGAIKNILLNPWGAMEAFFTNFLNNPDAEGMKQEFFLVFLVSGGFILLKKPQYLIVLLPIFGQKLFSDDYFKWGLSWQYSIEFAPILSIALFEYFSENVNKMTLRWGLLAIFLAGYTTFTKIENRLPVWSDGLNMKFYSKEHYKKPYRISEINKAIDKIPTDAKVSGEANIVPHLAARKTIYQFPKVEEAEYIILIPNDNYYYPLKEQEYKKKVKDLIQSELWEVQIQNENVILLRKR